MLIKMKKVFTNHSMNSNIWTVSLTAIDGEAGGSGQLQIEQAAPHRLIHSEYMLPAMMGGGQVSAQLKAKN